MEFARFIISAFKMDRISEYKKYLYTFIRKIASLTMNNKKLSTKKDENTPSKEEASEILDKLVLNQLHLMEEKMSSAIMIESKIREGSIHLAKARYIMGQTAVSTAQLPTEGSQEFSATVRTEPSEEKQFEVVKSDAENTINPLRWFGILVPQNMHKAQQIFQGSIKYLTDCAAIQYLMEHHRNNFRLLKKYIEYSK